MKNTLERTVHFKNSIAMIFCFISLVSLPEQISAQKADPEVNEYDTYWFHPKKSYEERCSLYLDYCVTSPIKGWQVIFNQIPRLELGREVEEDVIRNAVDFIYDNRDCSDFTLAALIRILYLYHGSPLLSRELVNDIENCLLDFKYWIDEPRDVGIRCYHSENHQIIFHSDELLAGQLFKEVTFNNDGKKGIDHMAHATNLIDRWMDFRVRFGWSEWLSNNYYEAHLLALLNLYDFAEDSTIRSRAGKLIDVLMFEMSLHNYYGVFGSTHGRAYARNIKGGWHEGTSPIMKLVFGMGVFNSISNMGAVALVTSSYRCPSIIEDIASDYSRPIRCRQRHSMNIEDAPKYGLSYTSEEDCYFYWSIADFTNPRIIDLTVEITNKYGIIHDDHYDNHIEKYYNNRDEETVLPDIDPHARPEVNIETYRTADWLLSCAQDFRKGKPGYQQHIWQATMGIDAVVYTNHPGSDNERTRPNYWAGNGLMPRAAQYKNTLICVYHIPPDDPFPFSHAYFPRRAFDEVVEKDHWIFGRKGDGYIGIYSQHPGQWVPDDAGHKNEFKVPNPDNIWICEMGSKKEWNDFLGFVDAVTSHYVKCNDLRIRYHSPSQGEIRFGWSEPLQVQGENISLREYKRFDNPYCQSDFNLSEILIKYKDREYLIDFNSKK
ncbi:MAG: hypothetical protein AMS26_22515 [Bacteroides sp. SM23_62]|nr:MAG: hypothetical protein AMS26_22515 [Bacteroides sp. SM23_62]